MRRIRWALLLVSLTATLAVSTGIGSASADQRQDRWTNPTSSDPGAPGLPQGDNVVELAPGVDLVMPSDSASVQASCSYYYVCLYEHPNYNGWYIGFRDCVRYRLGSPFYDSVTSIINNQTSGTVTWFYDLETGQWFPSTAYEGIPDLRSIGWDDRIDDVDVC